MSVHVLYTTSDNLLEIVGLTDALTGGIISNATVSCTLKTDVGGVVTGQTFPVTLTAQATPGTYAGTLKNTLALVNGGHYVAHVTIDGGTDKLRNLHIPFTAEDDDGSTLIA